jgi:integrase
MPKLTDKLIRDLTPPDRGSRVTFDTEVRGFGVRCTYRRAKAFVVVYRTAEGVQRQLTIGSSPDWSIAEARAEAARLKREIDQGRDPMAERSAARAAPTMNDLALKYFREHCQPYKRPHSVYDDMWLIRQFISGDPEFRTPAMVASGVEFPVVEFGKRKVASVTFDDISGLHAKVTLQGKRTTANRLVSLLSKMFNLARRWGWYPGDNPCKGVTRNVEPKRRSRLPKNEIERLLAAINEYPQRSAASAILFLFFTGARPKEVMLARWHDIDFEEGVWVKPSLHNKQKEEHQVPLAAAALGLLKTRRGEVDGEWVFPGRRRGRPLTSLSRPWRTICVEAGVPVGRSAGYIPYDLRHTFASLAVTASGSLKIAGDLLGHTQAQTTMRYVHLLDQQLREATNAVGRLLTPTRTAG